MNNSWRELLDWVVAGLHEDWEFYFIVSVRGELNCEVKSNLGVRGGRIARTTSIIQSSALCT